MEKKKKKETQETILVRPDTDLVLEIDFYIGNKKKYLLQNKTQQQQKPPPTNYKATALSRPDQLLQLLAWNSGGSKTSAQLHSDEPLLYS